jgi:hypothetical protein
MLVEALLKENENNGAPSRVFTAVLFALSDAASMSTRNLGRSIAMVARTTF